MPVKDVHRIGATIPCEHKLLTPTPAVVNASCLSRPTSPHAHSMFAAWH